MTGRLYRLLKNCALFEGYGLQRLRENDYDEIESRWDG